ncbi:unnamed protein product [Didymodactylos carnosus]|uniref:Uncharacterized protein n=1 Tax=Didymodactylos carnosus TaxID=1234261 RepID=A0A814FIY8_9BILA|nr:unnamed protein product [Didymodactylos carnosus]CAF0983626.1 unnamed protein product [Didymodactylos carnosus]CAF3562526.1 unnamed protein product [Didymodactylos carnosus]CAF3755995.1 unnamed protein product [Didymodactylos carnosus]
MTDINTNLIVYSDLINVCTDVCCLDETKMLFYHIPYITDFDNVNLYEDKRFIQTRVVEFQPSITGQFTNAFKLFNHKQKPRFVYITDCDQMYIIHSCDCENIDYEIHKNYIPSTYAYVKIPMASGLNYKDVKPFDRRWLTDNKVILCTADHTVDIYR